MSRTSLAREIEQRWYGTPGWLWLLWPLMVVFALLSALRRAWYRHVPGSVYRAGCKVIVIGNITVGGVGKTPLTLALATMLEARGFRVGIVSRGYGGKARRYPLVVERGTDPSRCGDEALIYASHIRGTVVVDPDRARGVKRLEAESAPDVILSDDGLQHYRLGRDMEIILLDGQRGIGNGHLLPLGPLREGITRLARADCLVINGDLEAALPAAQLGEKPLFMTVEPDAICRVDDSECLQATAFLQRHRRVHAIAGVGNPARFFGTLRALGFAIITHIKADHHRYSSQDLHFSEDLPVVMTEKDAVKCRFFADARCWYLRVKAKLPDTLCQRVLDCLDSGSPGTPGPPEKRT